MPFAGTDASKGSLWLWVINFGCRIVPKGRLWRGLPRREAFGSDVGLPRREAFGSDVGLSRREAFGSDCREGKPLARIAQKGSLWLGFGMARKGAFVYKSGALILDF